MLGSRREFWGSPTVAAQVQSVLYLVGQCIGKMLSVLDLGSDEEDGLRYGEGITYGPLPLHLLLRTGLLEAHIGPDAALSFVGINTTKNMFNSGLILVMDPRGWLGLAMKIG
ncbi:hypothetical protein KCV07_g382, partial [Aureobasidium melanogenum]